MTAADLLLQTATSEADRSTLSAFVAAVHLDGAGPSAGAILALSPPALTRLASYLQAYALMADCDRAWAASQLATPGVCMSLHTTVDNRAHQG